MATRRPHVPVEMPKGLPWSGTIPLPPVGVNHAYKIVRINDHMTLAKTATMVAWEQEAWAELRNQRCPTLPAKYPVCVSLVFTFETARPDVDGPIKAAVDALKRAMGGEGWDDRYVQRLEAIKRVDKAKTGVDITVSAIVQDEEVA